MLLTSSEMRALEERAFADGITAAALMEEAGARIAQAVRQFFPEAGECAVFFGKGHNGGDALVAARYLVEAGWRIDLRPTFPMNAWNPLTAQQYEALERTSPLTAVTVPGTGPLNREGHEEREAGRAESACDSGFLAPSPFQTESPKTLVVLDGLLGIGGGGALRPLIRAACREINRLRREENAHVFALDLPTGLDGDTGDADPDAVDADCTLTIGFAKTGLVADGAIDHVGRLAVLPLEELSKRAGTDVPVESESGARSGAKTVATGAPFSLSIATACALAPLLTPRDFDTHKGTCGRVGIIAGSLGFTGAAAMCAEAAVRGGAGLVTLYVATEAHAIVAARAAPEVMVQPMKNPLEVLDAKHEVLAVGPGLGHAHDADILELIARAQQPMILDADALNLLAKHPGALDRSAGPRLLTPHPGEMARLDPGSTKRSRRDTVEKFLREHPHTLLLKGARTLIGARGRPLSYNPTGHPGMAGGGMGDVLTGLLAALAGQGHSLYDAARLGSWLIGRAAELALQRGGESPESLRATSVLTHLGAAFEELRGRCY